MVSIDQIKRYRDTDPTYTVTDAIIEYLSGNPAEAKELAYQYWDRNDPDAIPFDKEFALEEVIGNMAPREAYWMGIFSEPLTDFNLYRLDGYGHFQAIGDEEEYMLDACKEAVDDIADGEYEISDELQDIIDLFDEDSRSNNRKPRASSGKKPVAKNKCTKKPAKSQCVKRGTSNGNAKKPNQSNNRKPRASSGKKPASRKASRRY